MKLTKLWNIRLLILDKLLKITDEWALKLLPPVIPIVIQDQFRSL